MAQIGNVSIFDPNEETFASYNECVEEYLMANGIGVIANNATAAQKEAADKKKVSVLITLVGPKYTWHLKRFVSLCLS